MESVDLIIKLSTDFYKGLKSDANGRYRSWEHCYAHFMKARGRRPSEMSSGRHYEVGYLRFCHSVLS